MKKIKKLQTNYRKNVRRVDACLFVFLLLYLIFHLNNDDTWVIFALIKNAFIFISNINSINGIINSIFLILLLLMLLLTSFIVKIIVGTFPYGIIALVVRNLYVSKLKKSNKYESEIDIDYFKDTFKRLNLTPGEVSVILNYDIEPNKDISATLMDLYLKKYITFSNNKIVVINKDLNNLKNSEKIVLQNIIENKTIESIKNVSIEDAINDGYLKANYLKQKKPIFKLVMYSIVFCLSILFLTICMPKYGIKIYRENFETFQKVNDTETLIELFNSKEFIKIEGPIVVFTSMCILAFALIILMPTYSIAYLLLYKTGNLKYLRTREGNILVDYLMALKNYINDFSLLNEKTKNELIIWEDFLVYAVLLEENEKVINEILKIKNVKLMNNNFIYISHT